VGHLVVADGGQVGVDRCPTAVLTEGEEADTITVEGVLQVLQGQGVVEDIHAGHFLGSGQVADADRAGYDADGHGQGRASGQLRGVGEQAAP
jgi:hypothetical protein